MTENDIITKLRKTLSSRRFRHTLSVARWAEALARRHGEDPGRARLAGLLHDCGKELSGKAQADFIRCHGIPVPGFDFTMSHKLTALLHAPVSGFLARRDFGVRDRRVLSAIRAHTMGEERMSRLDRILFVADFSSPDRVFPSALRVRRLAGRDLDAAFRETVRLKLRFVLEEGGPLHPLSVRVWNGLRK